MEGPRRVEPRRGFTRQPESPNVRVPAFKHHQNSTRRPPREGRKERNRGGRGKKERNFGAVRRRAVRHGSGPHRGGVQPPTTTTNNQQPPTTNNQQPTTNNQQPTTNNQQPTTNNQQPTTNNTTTTRNNKHNTKHTLAQNGMAAKMDWPKMALTKKWPNHKQLILAQNGLDWPKSVMTLLSSPPATS